MSVQQSVEKKDLTPKEQPKKASPGSLRYQRDKDRETVRGMFKNYEIPGGDASFCLRLHKGDQTKKYTMVDGQVYTIPLGVAFHLNQNCWYPVHKHVSTENGGHVMKVGQKVQRYGFQSLEFMDIDGLDESKKIVTIEHV